MFSAWPPAKLVNAWMAARQVDFHRGQLRHVSCVVRLRAAARISHAMWHSRWSWNESDSNLGVARLGGTARMLIVLS